MLMPLVPAFIEASPVTGWNEKVTSAFHSITSNDASKPTAFRFSCTYSFIGNGCIWPEPEVEMAILTLGFLVALYPASASSFLAAAGSYLMSKDGEPNQGWPGYT